MHELERRVIGKVMRRLIPFLILCYFVALQNFGGYRTHAEAGQPRARISIFHDPGMGL